ncbi:putative inactive histone-lysine N-methyltransferase SUVR2 isoform X6 [Canna indica]|uniref:Inactive histone-lysine N-methyltransferase SUVR2 isoform X6 n=1 Tax=Canna indica TaxID=4628 RepID=A0AAQ3KTF9_9LILI|nr:putative inactive histone-lysine N-methyltransferase SUVR2 isoform X6 [Canna indica]
MLYLSGKNRRRTVQRPEMIMFMLERLMLRVMNFNFVGPEQGIGQANNHGSLKSYSNLQNINMGTTQDVQRQNDERSRFVDACNKVTASVADSARNKVATSQILSVQESSSHSVDIASDLGEVKLTFSSSDRPNFHFPNLVAVFKQVEDKCLKSYKILEPSFSLPNLMKEMCQCFRDLSYETTGDKQENSLQLTPTVDSIEQHTTPAVYRTKSSPVNTTMFSAVQLTAPDGLSVMLRSDPSPIVKDRQDNRIERNKKMKKAQYLESYSLAMVQLQHTLAKLRPPHDINDISKGEEKVRISVLNELTNEKYPQIFHYILRNIVYQNAC